MASVGCWSGNGRLAQVSEALESTAHRLASVDLCTFRACCRGLNVLSVGGSAVQQGCTLLHADTNADTHVDVIAAQLEPSVVRDNAADLVRAYAP